MTKILMSMVLVFSMMFGLCACYSIDYLGEGEEISTAYYDEDDYSEENLKDDVTEFADDSKEDTTELEINDINDFDYSFRNEDLLNQHYEKHGIEMGFNSAEEYEAAAAAVIGNPDSLHKTEAEDGDDVYYLEETNEFVILSTDGYIRTYFNPNQGIDYYNRQ